MHFHRVQLIHRHHALRCPHHTVGINHHGLFVNITGEVDVRLFLREVEFFKNARILPFKGLLHARCSLCGINKTLTFTFNNRLHVRTQQLHHAFFAIWVFVRNHLTQEGLPHRSRAQRTRHFNRLNRPIRAIHNVQQVCLNNRFRNRLKVRLHVLKRIPHILTKGIHRKRLKHLLKQGASTFKERPNHLTWRRIRIGIAED